MSWPVLPISDILRRGLRVQLKASVTIFIIHELIYSNTPPHKLFDVYRSHRGCRFADDEEAKWPTIKARVTKIIQTGRDARANEAARIMQVAAEALIQTILEAGDAVRRI